MDYFEDRLISKNILQDEITKQISQNFDYKFEGESIFDVPKMTMPKNDFNIGLIVGHSGSGKTTLLKRFGSDVVPNWEDNKAIVSHFDSAEDAQNKLFAVGLNSVPTWFRPYRTLSTGEKYRADLARKLGDNTVVDEFTSVVDRSVAKSCSTSISKYIKNNNIKSVVFSSCHYDVVDWLQPDWVYDTLTQSYLARGSLCRPEIKLQVSPCGEQAWTIFRSHHYLTGDINRSAKHWLCTWGSNIVGFASALSMPSGTLKNAYRGHRTVVLPDYQGLGLGVRISDSIGEMHIKEGKRYFSKTTHPRMGDYRNKSPLWRPTSKNMVKRKDYKGNNRWKIREVYSYSHEYIGKN